MSLNLISGSDEARALARQLRSSNDWMRDPAAMLDSCIDVIQRSREAVVPGNVDAGYLEDELLVSLSGALEQYQMQAPKESVAAQAAASNVAGRLLDLMTGTRHFGVLTQCLRILGTFARAPACRENVSILLRQEGGCKFRDAFGVIRSTMGQSRQVAQAAVG